MGRGAIRAAFWAAILILALGAGRADASGFAIREDSAEALGTAFAGAASSADFLSTVYNNPAGMTQLTGNRVQLDGSILVPSIRFSGNASESCALCGAGGAPIAGSNGGDAGGAVFVPAGYAMLSLSPDLRLGLAVTSPYGLETDYAGDWVGRYLGIESLLETVDINPNVAYRVNNWLSVGGGLSAQYLYAQLTNAVDFNAIAGLPPGVFPDGGFRATGDGWGWGYNGGVLLQPQPGTNIGLTYRSSIRHTLSGRAEFTGVPAPFNANPAFADTGARSSLTTPATAEASITQALGDRFHVALDLQWTGWSVFKTLGVQSASGANIGTPTLENWHDTAFVAFGGTWNLDDHWALRSGIAFDQSPVSEQYRNVRLPDADRYWLSFGVGYKFSAGFSIDAGYAHIFMPSAGLDETMPAPGGADVIRGTYRLGIDLVSVQTRFRF